MKALKQSRETIKKMMMMTRCSLHSEAAYVPLMRMIVFQRKTSEIAENAREVCYSLNEETKFERFLPSMITSALFVVD